MWQMSDGLVPGKTLADEPKEVDIQVRTSRSVILSLYSRVSVTHLLVFPVFVAMHSAATVSARISVGLKGRGEGDEPMYSSGRQFVLIPATVKIEVDIWASRRPPLCSVPHREPAAFARSFHAGATRIQIPLL